MTTDNIKIRKMTQEELQQINQSILALATDVPKRDYTWEEKIDSLAELAKATGRYINAEAGTDYHKDARKKLFDTYEEFCQWRHDEPYVVDEIKALLSKAQY